MKKLKFMLVTSILAFTLMACKGTNTTEVKQASKEDNGLDLTLKEIQEDNQNKGEEQESDSYAFTLNNANIFDLDEQVDIDGIVFANLKTEIQKELREGISKEDVIYFYEQADENGRLEEGYTYIFADITITNTTEEEKVVYLSCGDYVNIDDKNNIVDATSELRYRSAYESSDATRRDYYRCVFRPKEEKQLELGYIAPESLVQQKHLLYSINLYGTGTESDDIRAIKVW